MKINMLLDERWCSDNVDQQYVPTASFKGTSQALWMLICPLPLGTHCTIWSNGFTAIRRKHIISVYCYGQLMRYWKTNFVSNAGCCFWSLFLMFLCFHFHFRSIILLLKNLARWRTHIPRILILIFCSSCFFFHFFQQKFLFSINFASYENNTFLPDFQFKQIHFQLFY